MTVPESITIIGGGITGLWQALTFAQKGRKITLFEAGSEAMTHACSWYAGGMLAPYCEGETAEPIITELGLRSIELWAKHGFPVTENGSLVVAHHRDQADLTRLARVCQGHRRLDHAEIAALEPDLADRFRQGLFFAAEAHVEPRAVIPLLQARLRELGAILRFDTPAPENLAGLIIDCRGLASRDDLPDLRAVKGEIAIVECSEISLSRPVRLMHPRYPIYLVPRGDGRYLIGATSIETEDADWVTVRSVLELLSAAYTVHPAFGEAKLLETACHFRPALPDNKPIIERRSKNGSDVIHVNGLYRHGYLLAPALAELTFNWLVHGQNESEVIHAGDG